MIGRTIPPYGVLADILVLVHFGFILFVVFGGLLLVRWRKLVYFHAPSVLWAGLLELEGWICPLTPLEMSARIAAGEAGYEGGFIEHYILPIIYPEALTTQIQIVLGVLVLSLNGILYFWIFLRRPRRKLKPHTE